MKTRVAVLAVMVCLVSFPVFATQLHAVLSGDNEFPGPGDPDGSGVASVFISGTSVSYTLAVEGLDAVTGAHIHTGPKGRSGTVVVDFSPTFNNGVARGVVPNVPQSTIDAILANPAAFYVNIHTGPFSGGAIRGQLEGVARMFYVDVVGKVTGALGTNFVNALQIVNQGVTPTTLTIDFFSSSATARTSPTATRTYQLSNQQMLVINDIVGEFGFNQSLGALRIHSTSPDVVVKSRIFNDQRATNEGTSGFLVPGKTLADALTNGVMPFASQASAADQANKLGMRTNLGFFNPNPFDITLYLTIIKPDGTFVGIGDQVTVPAYSHQQQSLFTFASSVPESERVMENFYVSFNATGPIFVYLGVNDNNTGDGTYVGGNF